MLDAQYDQAQQQIVNLRAEELNIFIQGAHVEAQTDLVKAQVKTAAQQLQNLQAEELNLFSQGLHVEAQADLVDAQVKTTTQQLQNLQAEEFNIYSQGLNLNTQNELTEWKIASERKQTEGIGIMVTDPKTKLTSLVTSADALIRSSVIERQNEVLTATACKLKAEYTHMTEMIAKVTSEKALLDQKLVTEQAQTKHIAEADSVIGKQLALYAQQTEGFKRDAEQKAAKLAVDAWSASVMADPNSGIDANPPTYAVQTDLINALVAGVKGQSTQGQSKP